MRKKKQKNSKISRFLTKLKTSFRLHSKNYIAVCGVKHYFIGKRNIRSNHSRGSIIRMLSLPLVSQMMLNINKSIKHWFEEVLTIFSA